METKYGSSWGKQKTKPKYWSNNSSTCVFSNFTGNLLLLLTVVLFHFSLKHLELIQTDEGTR